MKIMAYDTDILNFLTYGGGDRKTGELEKYAPRNYKPISHA